MCGRETLYSTNAKLVISDGLNKLHSAIVLCLPTTSPTLKPLLYRTFVPTLSYNSYEHSF